MTVVTLELPPPPRVLAPNARPNRWTKARAIKDYRHDCCVLLLSARHGSSVDYDVEFPLQTPVTASVTVTVRVNRKRDEDNALAQLKAMWDGIVDAGILAADDASALHIEGLTFVVGRVPGVCVVLEEVAS